MKTIAIATLASLTTCLCLVSSVAGGGDEPEVKARPLLVFTGDDSHVRDPALLRVSSADQWARIWRTHVDPKKDTLLEVDFKRCDLVAVFRGVRLTSRGVRIDSVEESGDAIVVRFENISFQIIISPFGSSAADEKTPYAFILLPKSEKVIVLEENVQSEFGQPPVWKERARLAAAER